MTEYRITTTQHWVVNVEDGEDPGDIARNMQDEIIQKFGYVVQYDSGEMKWREK